MAAQRLGKRAYWWGEGCFALDGIVLDFAPLPGYLDDFVCQNLLQNTVTHVDFPVCT